jgi:hypothetical protein
MHMHAGVGVGYVYGSHALVATQSGRSIMSGSVNSQSEYYANTTFNMRKALYDYYNITSAIASACRSSPYAC